MRPVITLLMLLTACAPRPAPRAAHPSLEPLLERLARNPDDVAARLELAEARLVARDHEGAILEAYKALASDPRAAGAHLVRARVYFERGLVAQEIEAYEAALAIDGSLVEARENLGHALLAAGRTADAAAQYRLVLERSPNAIAPLYNLALLATDAGDLETAKRLWARYLEVDPEGPWAERARAALEKLPEDR